MGRTKPIVTADYIVGITDGEGCFYVNMSKSTLYKSGVRVQLYFHIKLKEDDKTLLDKICNTLKCGNVYFQNEKRTNHTNCYRYTVSSQKDIFETIIPFFKKHNLQTTSKSKSFNSFCLISDMVKEKKHLTPLGIKKIRALKEVMNK